MRRSITFWVGAIAFLVIILLMTQLIGNEYPFFAGYVILQFVVLAVAWTILGGYAGYVNFGTAAFFALGAYGSVVMDRLTPLPIPVLVLFGGVVSGNVGLAMGYLTLRLRGVFFAIATLALAVVLHAGMDARRLASGPK